ncbi:RagB/SusD family nutrient uptake outer membrane protein [Ekhidna sp.]|uniref:RagB/SusD family nutrient uptake outer membrane protein n=1 Tax=Ekhidna sp. TaxID=2608089 RepID=UPI0035124EEF
MKKIKTIFFIVTITFSCSLLETDIPTTEILEEEAIKTKKDLQDLLNSAYDVVANYNNGLSQRLSELLSDNIASGFTDAAGFFNEIYNRNTNLFNSEVGNYYKEPYFAIHRANTLLEKVDEINLDEDSRNQIIAEARFIRAISHFNLVNLMAHPPGFTNDNSHLGIAVRTFTGSEPVTRSTVDETYDAIIKDLRFAEENLPESNGVYATSYAAQGYLSKVYFMEQNYDSAIYYASQIIDPGSPFSLVVNNINARYSQNITSEHIFYTLSTGAFDNRAGVLIGSYRSDVNEPFLKVSQELYDLANVNASDERAEWFEEQTREDGSVFYVTTKFNSNFQNVALIHMVDMLLTRAESLAILGTDLDQARADLNQVRNRAGVANISPISTQEQIIEAIRNERRLEMSLEGDRIMQLNRRGASGEDIQIRGANWDCPGSALQFPATEGFPGFVFNESGGC